jgi:hypothetical protein
MSALSVGLWTVLLLARRWMVMRDSSRLRRMRVWRRMAPEERPSASLSGTMRVFLFAFALLGCV